jgi:hypothetical protein
MQTYQIWRMPDFGMQHDCGSAAAISHKPFSSSVGKFEYQWLLGECAFNFFYLKSRSNMFPD